MSNPTSKVRETTRSTGPGQQMSYEDALRKVTYTTKARVVGPHGDLTGETIVLTLGENGQDVERLEATAEREVQGSRPHHHRRSPDVRRGKRRVHDVRKGPARPHVPNDQRRLPEERGQNPDLRKGRRQADASWVGTKRAPRRLQTALVLRRESAEWRRSGRKT